MKNNNCPITGWRFVKPCPVTTCMWHSTDKQYPNKCAFKSNNPPDIIWSQIKHIPLETVARLRKYGVESIQKVLLLQKYEQWLIENQSNLTSGLNIKKISKVLSNFPFTYPTSRWTEVLLKLAISNTNYEKFLLEERVSKKMELASILGFSKKQFNLSIYEEKTNVSS